MMQQHAQIVIIGGGFAGIQAAKTLAGHAPEARILLLDRNNYHTFTPLLYQVATAAIDPEEIAYPIRSIFRKQKNVAFEVTEISSIDLTERTIRTADGPVSYDYLILAAGSTSKYFGVQGAEQTSFGLKDLQEAVKLRNHLLTTVETAAGLKDPNARRELLTVVIVGGGPTGVELAGAVTELIRKMIAHDYPMLNPADVQVLLVEAGARLLSAFRPALSNAASRYFRRNHVDVRLQTSVTALTESSVTFSNGVTVRTPSVIWAAGVEARQLLSVEPALAAEGRLPVQDSLQLEGHPEVYVVGDMAGLRTGSGLLPMLAPVGMQQGKCAAINIAEQIAGRPPKSFRYFDRGMMATLGRSNAVAQVGPVILTGFIAWVAWLGLHLVELIGFRNRALVLVNWIWVYFFFASGARVILDRGQSNRTD